MKVFGADFSGARNPSRGIYYAEGCLQGDKLVIEQIVQCDDRLDLLAAIYFSKAPWGLDFPFSLPKAALNRLNIDGWAELLLKAAGSGRSRFARLIEESGLPSCEARCLNQSVCCRATDASISSFSPLKNTNPNMRAMTYAGLKLLSYLRGLGGVVYPFDRLKQEAPRVYEVYPAHTWRRVGLSRRAGLKQLVEQFGKKYDFKVEAGKHLVAESADAADAAVACVTTAYALKHCGLEDDWSRKHSWLSAAEWANRYHEGLVVKVT